MSEVASKFKDFSGKEITEYMHEEEVYQNTANGEIILYSKSHFNARKKATISEGSMLKYMNK